jgi:hypothetical protein
MENEDIDPIQANLLKQNWFGQWHLFAAWLYLIIILFDFLIAPIVNIIILAYFKYAIVQWNPVTLQGGGIFHVAMLSIIGIATWGRNMQLIEAVRNMPDYSNSFGGYGNNFNGYGQGSYNQGQSSPNMPLNNPVDPATILQAPRRGMGKGT